MKAQPKVIRASTEFSPVEGLKRDWESGAQDPMLPVENILIWIPPGDKYDIIYNLGWVGGFVCGGVGVGEDFWTSGWITRFSGWTEGNQSTLTEYIGGVGL